MAARDRDLERLIPIQNPDINNNNIITNGGSNSSSESVSPIISSHHSSSEEVIEFSALYLYSNSHKPDQLRPSFVCMRTTNPIVSFCFLWPSHSASLGGLLVLWMDSSLQSMLILESIYLVGLGFVTSISFIFLIGVFMSSWLGASVLGLGEWFIKKMPFVSYIYSASKQISAAISPDQSSNAFKEVAIIRHPRHGEYAFGFITSIVILRGSMGAEELCCVYVPTNHLYLGDIFLISSKDILRPNLSVREGIEIVISGGMSIPQILNTMDSHAVHATGLGKFAVPPV
ncbi:hypothetical protein POTOM_021279 [Populus tomentosa]|uniref:Protein LIKE COV 3 n=1 Tax=Populus tomentosa TaxID=118781 RepID=A0A8X8D0T3_POPTO|nr:hypothetical protein POTOM_021279 [Populus tomentosa]